jgi:hypothetical protein
MTARVIGKRRGHIPELLLWLMPMLFVLLVGMYFTARYEGRWAESDTTAFTQYMRIIAHEGRLVGEEHLPYPNGYAFQSLSVFVLASTGTSAATLQQLIYPMVAALVVLPAWLLFREWTGNARGAAIGTLLLFTQPEFLFVILRSSHEKFTRLLLLLCLYWLTRSFKLHNQPRAFVVHVGLFYLTAYGLITSNNLLAHSFIFAVICALLVLVMLHHRKTAHVPDRLIVGRLPYVAAICLGLAYLFTFYLYPPAQHDLLVIHDLWNRIGALFLDVETQTSNPYVAVQAGWVNIHVYFAVSIANWLLLVSSFVIWVYQGMQWLRRGEPPASLTRLLVWLFYSAFALQGALSVIADQTGALGGNLQHRLFSSFSIAAVGLVSTIIADWQPQRYAKVLRTIATTSLALLAVLAILKAMNEPLLSNKWTFYRGSEMAALGWSDQYLKDSWIWSEFDERLQVAYTLSQDDQPGKGAEDQGNLVVSGGLGRRATDFLVTDVTRLRSIRLGQVLPVPLDAHRVYDNGSAELYHARPLTPYQR